MKFNKEQQRAIDSRKNCLISAGAGSGKTAVLTEKVFQLIEKGGIDPKNLLVLTFTNAAAYSMKQKIIRAFKKNSSNKALEIVSSHIETFDAFSAFLVRKYSFRLKVDPNFKMVNQSLFDAKTMEIIDKILATYYKNEENETFKELIYDFAFKGDDTLKEILFTFYKKLSNYSLKEKEDFIYNYEEKYLKEEFIAFSIGKIIKNKVLIPFFNHISSPLFDVLNKHEKINVEYNYLLDTLKNVEEIDENETISLYQKIIDYLTINKLPQIRKFAYKSQYDKYKKFKDDYLKKYAVYLDIDSQKELLFSYKNKIKLIIEILIKVDDELEKYKSLNSSYDFSDISKKASSLLIKDEFNDIKEEIRNTYKYILVDEYQDTNDIQEEFLNNLTIGTNNKLFVVGDVKQSIYAFRNANPSLFINRKNNYLNDLKNNEVIDMNINYRSFSEILELINRYFKANMSKNNGGIVFNTMEELIYDNETDLYKNSDKYINGDHGMKIIFNNAIDYSLSRRLSLYNDAMLIIKDILKKINSNYEVFDEDSPTKRRKVNFGDFAVLTRKNKDLAAILKIFKEFGIPSNIKSDVSYIDAHPIRVLESLIKLYLAFKNNDESNLVHLYVSLARSFLYSYSDEEIYNLINSENKIKLIKDSEIYIKMRNFYINFNNIESFSLSSLIEKMIIEFDFNNALIRLGDYEDNLNYLEYFYYLVKDVEGNGGNIFDLLNTLELMVDNDIELTASNLVDNTNSVELATIHKSKGLEYKILYIPFRSAISRDKPKMDEFMLSKEYGALFKKRGYSGFSYTLLNKDYIDEEAKSEKDEFERLLYVALTRAKESIIFVGNSYSSKSFQKNSLEKEFYNAFNKKIIPNLKTFDLLEKYGILDKNSRQLILDYIDVYNAIAIKDIKNKCVEEFIKFEREKDIISLGTSLRKDKPYHYSTGQGSVKDFLPNENVYEYFKVFATNKDLINLSNSILYNLRVLKEYLNNDFRFVLFRQNKTKKFVLTRKDRRMYYFVRTFEEFNSKNDNDIWFDSSSGDDFFLVEAIDKLNLLNGESFEPLFIEIPLDPIKYEIYDYKEVIKPISATKDKEYKNLEVNDEIVVFKEKENKKASHSVSLALPFNKEMEEKLKEGIRLHQLLEYFNFKNPDYSFIKNETERKIIDKILSLDIFKDIKKANIYKEYQYLAIDQEGIIDLLLVYDDHIDIIDYKTKNIDDEAYINQLNIYRENIDKLFNKGKKKYLISCYLLSLIDGIYKKID